MRTATREKAGRFTAFENSRYLGRVFDAVKLAMRTAIRERPGAFSALKIKKTTVAPLVRLGRC